MIASLSGKISYKTSELRKDGYVVLDVNGVGYKVFIPKSNLKNLEEGRSIIVYTYFSVSEYSMDLYGFLDPADKTFFTLLLDVPGIGPKKAMDILGKTTMREVQQAIIDDDYTLLTKVSGLSEKTAEKIVMTLKSKVESLSARPKDGAGQVIKNADVQAFEALVDFGYSAQEAKRALGQVDKSVADVGERIKQALKLMGR